jgi:hypothetical protein
VSGEEDERGASESELAALVVERARLEDMHKVRLKDHHNVFHPIWGQMLKAGYQNSMYANLMERFACLYTSHVCNLMLYSPYMKFRGRVDVMAHEQVPIADHGRDVVLDCLENRGVLQVVRPAGSQHESTPST